MIYRFAVTATNIYFADGVAHAIRPSDRLSLTGGTDHSFICTVHRAGELLATGVEIPLMDVEHVRFFVNCPAPLIA